jgi:CubicO group peptidase (beta-lactamase class C family)
MLLPDELFPCIREKLTKLNIPGVTISIVHNGTVHQDFVGTRNLNGDPVDSDTLIEQASVTKGIFH